MNTDYIDQSFSGLDDYYPGSKRKRRVAVDPVAEFDNEGWASRPIKKRMPNGKELELFTIGALAAALGRPVITVRTWIKEGYLPSSPYRLPTTKNRNGNDHKGRRLYSKAMVEKAIELFAAAGLLTEKRIEWSTHRQLSDKIAEAWNQIRADETM